MADEHMTDADLAQLLGVLCDFAEEHGWPTPGLEAVRALARTLHRKLLENRLCNMFMQAFPNATVYGFHGVEGLLAQAERLAVRSYRAGRCSQDEFAECIRLCAQLREAGCVPSREVEEEIDRLMRPASEDPEHQEWLRRTFTLGDYRPRPQSVTIGPAPVFPKDTAITLTDARYVMIGDVLDFDGEVMGVTASPDVETGTVAVTRALRGTVAAGHPAGEVGRLIGNTRTGRESAAERSRRVREDLDLTPPDHPLCPLCHGEPVTAGGRLCAECSAHYVAYPETDGLTIRSRTPVEAPAQHRPSLRAERMTRAWARLAELSDSESFEDRGRLVDLVTQARRWVADDLEVGKLTSESAAERLRLLDELAGRAEGT